MNTIHILSVTQSTDPGIAFSADLSQALKKLSYSYLTSFSYTNFPKGRFSFVSEQMKSAPGWSGFHLTSIFSSALTSSTSHHRNPLKTLHKNQISPKSHVPCQACFPSVPLFSLWTKCEIIFLYHWIPGVSSSYFSNQLSNCWIFKDLPIVSFWGHL